LAATWYLVAAGGWWLGGWWLVLSASLCCLLIAVFGLLLKRAEWTPTGALPRGDQRAKSTSIGYSRSEAHALQTNKQNRTL
jgi:hypothetical protein